MTRKGIIPHAIAVAVFALITIIYCSPMLEGKVLFQNDVLQSDGMAREAEFYHEEKDDIVLWTQSGFSGMPTYMIYMKYPLSLFTFMAGVITYRIPQPANLIFFGMIGFYIMAVSLGFRSWMALLGGIAMGLSSFLMISVEAGHATKILAAGYAPAIIGGVILVYRGRYLLGAILTMLFTGLEVYCSHPQITYYVLISLVILAVFQFVKSIRENQLPHFFKASAILVTVAIVAGATHTTPYWLQYEYAKETIRGKSELISKAEQGDGLDRDYAFSWSYGKIEVFTLLIPDLYGGASGGSLSKNSNTYETLINQGVPANSAEGFIERLPLYWGDQPFTSGPAYAGAIILFLALVAVFHVRNEFKWWLIGTTLFFIVLSWGDNFPTFNYLMFDYFPMYNKFRSITMIIGVAQIFIVLLALMGLRKLLLAGRSKDEMVELIKLPGIILGGILLFFLVLGGSFLNFQSPSDTQFVQNLSQSAGQPFAQKLMGAIEDDRASMFRMDAIRSFVFIALAAAMLWLFSIGKIKETVLTLSIVGLVLIDLWMVDKRYFNNDDFVQPRAYDQQTAPSAADRQILQDEDEHFRVYNMNYGLTSSAIPSYYHKSVGGYHGAKLRRYQDVVETQMAAGNPRVFNMLNTKYIIGKGKDGQPVAQQNPNNLGDAWFVSEYKIAQNADEELSSLADFDPGKTALIDQRYADYVDSLKLKSGGKITLNSYHPEEMIYRSENENAGFAVFPEIFYRGNEDWKAYIDDEYVPHIRTDYILRGLKIPAGNHKVSFKFYPKAYHVGQIIDLIASVLLLGMCLMGVLLLRKKNRNEDTLNDEIIKV